MYGHGQGEARRARSSVALALVLAVLWVCVPHARAEGQEGPSAETASARRAARSGVRARAASRLQGDAGAAGPVHAAAEGDALAIADPVDASHPKGDLRQVLIGDGGVGTLRFTMQVEQYSNPLVDPAWVVGVTGALWFLDTSGDTEPEIGVEVFNDGTGLVGVVFDAFTGVFVCDAVPSTNAANKTYTATVNAPGCLGDVKQPAGGGIFFLDDPLLGEVFDFAPNTGILVRFNRPSIGQPAGGYAMVNRGAGFHRFGAMPPGATPGGVFEDYIGPGPVVGAASARPFDPGLWSVTSDGEVSTQDGAEYYGDATSIALARPIVGMTVLADRSGYWLVASDGGIFAYGDAGYFGSMGGKPLNRPIVGMAASPTGEGYWLVASDGGIFAFGDAGYHGSTGAMALNRPVVGMAPGYQGQGYWLVGSDGGIFAFGLPFYGSTGAMVLQQPIVGMAATRSGGGYRFVARDGGVFCFGDAEFHGSAAQPGRTDIVGLATA